MQSSNEISDVADAETRVQLAFERICCGKTRVIPHGSKVSQANVAREAGVDPSALRKARYPKLIATIRRYLESEGNGTDSHLKARSKSKSMSGAEIEKLRSENKILRERADLESSKLVSLYSEYVALQAELEALKVGLESGKVKFLKPR